MPCTALAQAGAHGAGQGAKGFDWGGSATLRKARSGPNLRSLKFVIVETSALFGSNIGDNKKGRQYIPEACILSAF